MGYSQEKRSFKSKPLLMFINLFLFRHYRRFIYFPLGPLLLSLYSPSDVSATSLHTSSLHSSLACLSACPSLLLSRKNINRPSLFLFSRTVFSNCKPFATYLHMYLLKRFLSTQANKCVSSRRASSAAISRTAMHVKSNISIV